MSKETTATTPSTSTITCGAHEMADRILSASLDKAIAALPAAVHAAMWQTLPEKYTPELADAIAAGTIANLNPLHQHAVCPWPGLCTDTTPGHYDHASEEHVVNGKSGERLLDVGMVDVSDGAGAVVYIGGMTHEDFQPEEVRPKTAELRQLLDTADEMADQVLGNDATVLAAIDRQIEDDMDRLIARIAHRRRTAIKLNPGRTPFTEPEAEQVSAAAFHLATLAFNVSLEKGPEPVGTLRSMRSWLDMAATEVRS